MSKKFIKNVLLFSLLIVFLLFPGCKKGEANKCIQEGDKLAAAGDYNGALEQYQKALEILPSYEEAKKKVDETRTTIITRYMKEKEGLIKEGKYDEAIDIWNKIVKLEPSKSDEADKDKEKIAKMAEKKELSGNLEKAIKLIKEEHKYKEGLELLVSITDIPGHKDLSSKKIASIHYYKGFCYYNIDEIGNFSNARKELELALKEGLGKEMTEKAEEIIRFVDLEEELQEEYGLYRETMADWITAMNSPDPKDRIKAYETIGEAKNSQFTAFIVEGLKDEDPDVRNSAIRALAQVKDPRAIMYLNRLYIEDEDNLVRAACIKALGDIGEPEAITIVQKAFEDKDHLIAAASVYSAILLDPSEGEKFLGKTFLGKDKLKEEVDNMLSEVPQEDLIPILFNLLKNDNKDVVIESARLLGKYGDKDTVKDLKEFIKDGEENEDVKEAVEESIEKLEKKFKSKEGTDDKEDGKVEKTPTPGVEPEDNDDKTDDGEGEDVKEEEPSVPEDNL